MSILQRCFCFPAWCTLKRLAQEPERRRRRCRWVKQKQWTTSAEIQVAQWEVVPEGAGAYLLP